MQKFSWLFVSNLEPALIADTSLSLFLKPRHPWKASLAAICCDVCLYLIHEESVNGRFIRLAPLQYRVSADFHKLVFLREPGVEPLLILDHDSQNSPQRIFMVRYVIGEGGGEEGRRAIFKDELTGYDCESNATYHTQKVDLENLQATLEPLMYGSPEARYCKLMLENASTGEQRPIKAIVSEKLVASLVGLYGYGW
jgi:hypothetical protein